MYICNMNKAVRKLYSCTLNNRVVVCETNFKDFCDQFKKIEPTAHSCRWFDNRLKDNPEFEYEIEGKKYYFQRLV